MPGGSLVAGTRDAGRGGGPVSRTEFSAPADATSYAAVGSFHSSFEGADTLSATDVTDIAADSTTAGAVPVGGSTRGRIHSAGHEDRYAFELEEGQTYRIDPKGSSGDAGAPGDPFPRGIHNSQGALLDGTTNDSSRTGNGSHRPRAFQSGSGGNVTINAQLPWAIRSLQDRRPR